MPTEFFDTLVTGLTEGLDHVRGNRALRTSTVSVPPPPPEFSAQRIRDLRQTLNLSQAGFSRLLNVSSKTVQSWEHGTRQPSQAAARLLQVIEQPDVLAGMTTHARC